MIFPATIKQLPPEQQPTGYYEFVWQHKEWLNLRIFLKGDYIIWCALTICETGTK